MPRTVEAIRGMSEQWPRRSRIFLLGAAGEQEENGLGASASGPARNPDPKCPPRQ
jgi:hypothetical protein